MTRPGRPGGPPRCGPSFLRGRVAGGRPPSTKADQATTFDLATNERFTVREGERRETTEWHRVVCFGRRAEVAAQYLSCGKKVFIEGRIKTRSWEDRDTGERRDISEIICRNLQMLDRNDRFAAPAPEPQAGDLGPEPEDDDIPF